MKVSCVFRLGLAIAALLTVGTAVAQGPGVGPGFDGNRPPMERMLGPHGNHGHWWNNPTMIEKLKLTDDQRKAMDQILLNHREKLIDLRANLEKTELLLPPMLREDQPNEAAILAQIDKIAQARADLEKANARFLLAIRGKLTADQWKTLQAEWREHRMMGRGMGRRMGPPPGPMPSPGPQTPEPPAAGPNQ